MKPWFTISPTQNSTPAPKPVITIRLNHITKIRMADRSYFFMPLQLIIASG